MTNEGMKGDKREKSVEVDTDLSWDHEGLKPIPKESKNKLDMSPKPPRIPRMLGTKTNAGHTSKEGCSAKEREINEGKYPEVLPKTNESKEIPPRAKQNFGMDKGDKKFNEKLDLEKSSNPVDKKTARWIEEQNELMGKQREQGTDRDRKERDVPTFSPSNSIKVLQRAKSIHHTNYERPPQYSMGAQGGQAPQLPMIATNQRNGSWVNQGKRYPLKERFKNQWGGHGKQYGTNSEKGGYQTYKTDGNQAQGHGTTYGSPRRRTYNPTRGLESGQGGDGGNGDGNDKKRYRDTKVSQENDSCEEESDTENSYEFEITSQQLSQITPGGGALKVKLSKKKPLKITAGAPGGSQTIPMELEHIPSPKRFDPRSQVDTTSESTLPTRGTGAPLFISPILPESDLEPLEETSPRRESGLRGSPRYELTREKGIQELSKQMQVKQESARVPKPPKKGNGGDPPERKNGDRGSPDKGRGPPRRNNSQAGGGGDDDPDPGDDGGEDDTSSSDSSAPRKRKHKSPKYVYVLQGPPGPKGQEGQPG